MSHKISRKIFPILIALLNITSNCMGSQEAPDVDTFFLMVYHCNRSRVHQMLNSNPELANTRCSEHMMYPQSLLADLLGARPDTVFERPLHAVTRTHHNWFWERIIRTMGSRIETARLLIQHGANVNSTGEYDRTPLGYAAAFSDYDLAKFLIQHGAQVDGVNGCSPLNPAAENGNMHIVQLLIENGADVNAISAIGGTPLYSAAKNGDINIMLLLIEHGANVNVANKEGIPPLNGAARKGNRDAARLLIEHGSNVDAADREGFTPLHQATIGGDITLLQLLVQHGADTNAVSEYGTTPFFYAIRQGYLDIATYLLRSGAEIDYKYINPPMFSGHRQPIIFLLRRYFYVHDRHAGSIETQGVNDWREIQADAGKDLFAILYSEEMYAKIQLPKDLIVLILSLVLSPDAYTVLHSSLREAGEFNTTESGNDVSLSEEDGSWLSQLPAQLKNCVTSVLCVCLRRR